MQELLRGKPFSWCPWVDAMPGETSPYTQAGQHLHGMARHAPLLSGFVHRLTSRALFLEKSFKGFQATSLTSMVVCVSVQTFTINSSKVVYASRHVPAC